MEPGELDAARAEWRWQRNGLESTRRHEAEIQRCMRRERSEMEREREGPLPDPAIERRIDELRRHRAALHREFLEVAEWTAAAARKLSAQSRADAWEAVLAAEASEPAAAIYRWHEARERLLDGLPERLAALVEDEGLRPVAQRCGISHTYVARLMRGRRPTDAPLRALGAAYPDAFPEIPRILAAIPQAARPPGRPLKDRDAEAPAVAGIAEMSKRPQFRVDEDGRTHRVAGALDELVRPFAQSGVDYLLRVEGDWLAPDIRRGDIAFVSVNAIPHPGSILLVEDARKRSSLRRMASDPAGQTVYASSSPERFPSLTPADARITGVIPGLLRSEPAP
ncbi:MAG TPA: S24 family peptidase [Armatimonadota bacterium]|jgi:hypothetical protein